MRPARNRQTPTPSMAGIRFPRSMAPTPAHVRLLETLGVELVADVDAELADVARAWLATVPTQAAGSEESAAAVRLVRAALERHDNRTREAA